VMQPIHNIFLMTGIQTTARSLLRNALVNRTFRRLGDLNGCRLRTPGRVASVRLQARSPQGRVSWRRNPPSWW